MKKYSSKNIAFLRNTFLSLFLKKYSQRRQNLL